MSKVESIIVAFPNGERRELTIEEARALHSQLNELFGTKDVPIYITSRWPRIVENPQPIYWTSEQTPSGPPEVWCKTEGL